MSPETEYLLIVLQGLKPRLPRPDEWVITLSNKQIKLFQNELFRLSQIETAVLVSEATDVQRQPSAT